MSPSDPVLPRRDRAFFGFLDRTANGPLPRPLFVKGMMDPLRCQSAGALTDRRAIDRRNEFHEFFQPSRRGVIGR